MRHIGVKLDEIAAAREKRSFSLEVGIIDARDLDAHTDVIQKLERLIDYQRISGVSRKCHEHQIIRATSDDYVAKQRVLSQKFWPNLAFGFYDCPPRDHSLGTKRAGRRSME